MTALCKAVYTMTLKLDIRIRIFLANSFHSISLLVPSPISERKPVTSSKALSDRPMAPSSLRRSENLLLASTKSLPCVLDEITARCFLVTTQGYLKTSNPTNYSNNRLLFAGSSAL